MSKIQYMFFLFQENRESSLKKERQKKEAGDWEGRGEGGGEGGGGQAAIYPEKEPARELKDSNR